jgi:hypothetical protein
MSDRAERLSLGDRSCDLYTIAFGFATEPLNEFHGERVLDLA